MLFGFTKNSSTLQQLFIFLSDIYNSYELGRQIDVIYTDFKKAFDTVPHDEILFKLCLSVFADPFGNGFVPT